MKISIKVKTKSVKRGVFRTDNGYIVCVNEPPVEGRANRAVIEVLSEYFNVPKSGIKILSGLKSKNKIVEIN